MNIQLQTLFFKIHFHIQNQMFCIKINAKPYNIIYKVSRTNDVYIHILHLKFTYKFNASIFSAYKIHRIVLELMKTFKISM